MSDPARLDSDPNEDRIAKWRAERLRIAAREKEERLAARNAAKDAARKEAEALRKKAALSLIPTEPELLRTQERLSRNLRRARMAAWAQFAALVLLPLAAIGAYLGTVATPLYEARSVVAVTKPSSAVEQNTNGLLGSLNAPTNLQEVFMAHEFVRSQALMDQLEAEHGFVSTLRSDTIDPVARLRILPGLPFDLHDQFGRFVESTVDVQTGLITLYVRAPDPEQAVAVSDTILALANAQINTLNDELYAQRLRQANDAVARAQSDLTAVQSDLVALQIKSRELDPRERIASIYDTIRRLEEDALALNSDLQKAEIAGRGESFLAQQTAEMEGRLHAQIDAQRQLLVSDGNSGGTSLNAVLMQYEMAELQVRAAEGAVASALAALTEANRDAALSRSLFQVIVPPRTGQAATLPNAPSIMVAAFAVLMTAFVFFRLLRASRQTGLA